MRGRIGGSRTRVVVGQHENHEKQGGNLCHDLKYPVQKNNKNG